MIYTGFHGTMEVEGIEAEAKPRAHAHERAERGADFMSQVTNGIGETETGEKETGAAGVPTYQPGQRAPAFDSATAAYMGARGGVASGAARRKKKAMRELAQMILDKKVTDDEINDRLRALGILPEEKSGGGREKRRATVGMAILGHMADMAMMHRSEKEAAASVKAGETLIRIASGEIGLPTEDLHGQDGEAPGGVVLMPAADPSQMDGMPDSDREPEDGDAGKSQADGILEAGNSPGGAL